jgi:hypothetical protein
MQRHVSHEPAEDEQATTGTFSRHNWAVFEPEEPDNTDQSGDSTPDPAEADEDPGDGDLEQVPLPGDGIRGDLERWVELGRRPRQTLRQVPGTIALQPGQVRRRE